MPDTRDNSGTLGRNESANLFDSTLDGPPSGLVDFSVCDTTPGSRCSLAPPAGVRLTPEEYTDLLRTRYRGDRGHRVHMAVFSRRLHGLRFAGPFVFEARKALEAIAK
jgi:hypothetical protein